MIRRFIQKQQVRIAYKFACKRQPLAPAARERAGLYPRVREPNPAQSNFGLRFLFEQLTVYVGERRHDDIVRSLLNKKRSLLRNVAQPDTLAYSHNARVGLKDS